MLRRLYQNNLALASPDIRNKGVCPLYALYASFLSTTHQMCVELRLRGRSLAYLLSLYLRGLICPWYETVVVMSSRHADIQALRTAIERGSDGDLHDILNDGLVDTSSVVDIRNRSTPLHLACVHGRWEMVEMLIECGADVFAEDRGGRTPGDIAAAYPHLESYVACVQLLVREMNRLLSARGSTALHYATSRGKHEFVNALRRLGMVYPDDRNADGFTATQIATPFARLR